MRTKFFLLAWLLPVCLMGQKVDNVEQSFKTLSTQPQIINIENKLEVPTEQGHLQGIQLVERDGKQKLLISGSSKDQAYLLQVDIASKKSEKLIQLMSTPYRHAGGIQASGEFLAVGIEDNVAKTMSKVCVYPIAGTQLEEAKPSLIIERYGKAERNTAGATGMLSASPGYLVVVGDWNSRNWDFYQCSPQGGNAMQILSYAVPDGWPAYQSINLIADRKAIYAIGLYQLEAQGAADLILVSNLGIIEPIMEKVATKTFHCSEGVDFQAAAGLQVDEDGRLHVWATQKDALERLLINKYSPK